MGKKPSEIQRAYGLHHRGYSSLGLFFVIVVILPIGS